MLESDLNRVNVPLVLFHCCDEMPSKSNFRAEEFILAYSAKANSP